MLSNIVAATQKMRECQVQQCAKEVKANKSTEEKVKKQVKKLIADFSAKKITMEEMKEKALKIRDDALKIQSNIDLLKCSIEQCNKNVMDLMKINMEAIEQVCKLVGNKDACEFIKAHKKMGKKLNFEQYMKIVQEMSKLLST